MRIKRHYRYIAGVPLQGASCCDFKRANRVAHFTILILDFDQQWDASIDQRQNLRQGLNGVCAAFQLNHCQRVRRALLNWTCFSGQPVQRIVMENHCMAIRT